MKISLCLVFSFLLLSACSSSPKSYCDIVDAAATAAATEMPANDSVDLNEADENQP